MAALAQIIGLVGVIAGAGVGYLISSRTERARWERIQSTRWDQDKLRGYTQFAEAVKDLAIISARLAATRGLKTNHTPLPEAEGMNRLDEAEIERSRRFEAVLLLGDSQTVSAAQELNRAIWRLMDVGSGLVPAEQEDWWNRFAAYRAAREGFYHAARAGMGVPYADIPLSSWLAPSQTEVGEY